MNTFQNHMDGIRGYYVVELSTYMPSPVSGYRIVMRAGITGTLGDAKTLASTMMRRRKDKTDTASIRMEDNGVVYNWHRGACDFKWTFGSYMEGE